MLAEPAARSDVGDPTSPTVKELAQRLTGRTIAIDCRWLGIGGTGRVTQLLLGGLREVCPAGTWLLWGDPTRLSSLTFPGALVVPWHGRPTRLFGQADVLRVPAADVVVYLHQIRPLRPGRSVTVVHDTIPLRFERHRLTRAGKRLFLRVACLLSARIITVSAWSRGSIVRDLGIPASRIVVTTLGVDPERLARVRTLRSRGERLDQIVYVGRFAEHKNLVRLCRAFDASAFRRCGGRLVLVGGSREESAALAARTASEGLTGIDVRGECPEAELDDLLATCRALVQPSLEEGYGLPAVEAAAVGIPVAVSPTGYANEIPASLASFLDPLDESSITAAIDAAASRSDAALGWTPPSSLAADMLAAIEESIQSSN